MARFVLVVLDGLRPDRVSTGSMPALSALAAGGTSFANARSVFPSETRVATSSLLTGCRPGGHGLVANTLYDGASARRLRTDDAAHLAVLGPGASPLTAPSLGERLAAAGRSLAVVSSGTAGSAVLAHPMADGLGAFRWNVEDAARPVAARVRATLGDTPGKAVPNAPRIGFALRVLLDVALPARPDVAVLWCSEPDITFHAHGVGSPEAAAALRLADGVVAEVAAWRDVQADAAEIGLVVLSDHGHVTGSRRIDVASELRAAGFAVGEALGPEVEIVAGGGGAPGLWLREAAMAPRVAAWLAAQDWAGPVLVRDPAWLPGAPTLALLGAAHPRSPDLVVTFAGEAGPDALGVPGTAPYDAGDVPVGGGMHGGLHRRELATVLVMQGGSFRAGAVVRAPCDLADVVPTLLHALGVDATGCEGRVLAEAWDAGAEPDVAERAVLFGAGWVLEVAEAGGRTYPGGMRRG